MKSKKTIVFTLNGKKSNVTIAGNEVLLWALREKLGMYGVKYGCGRAVCGACTVLVDGEAVRSCVYPVQAVDGKDIITVEGLTRGDRLHPVQQAWLEEGVPQCGYCQPGFIMATIAFLKRHPEADDELIRREITNLCRCGTYYRIFKAIKRAARMMKNSDPNHE